MAITKGITIYDILRQQFGVETYVETSEQSVVGSGTTENIHVIPKNPQRVGIVISNNSRNDLFISIAPLVPTQPGGRDIGIRIGRNSFWYATALQDFSLPAERIYVKGTSSTQYFSTTEVFTKLERI